MNALQALAIAAAGLTTAFAASPAATADAEIEGRAALRAVAAFAGLLEDGPVASDAAAHATETLRLGTTGDDDNKTDADAPQNELGVAHADTQPPVATAEQAVCVNDGAAADAPPKTFGSPASLTLATQREARRRKTLETSLGAGPRQHSALPDASIHGGRSTRL